MKKLLVGFSLTAIAFILISSGNSNDTYLNIPPDIDKYEIGDTAQGGIIFMLNNEGTHGLVVALEDQFANSTFSEGNEMINDPRFHDKYGQKYFDWRLPRLWEAYELYKNLHIVNLGSFSNSGYWTNRADLSFDKMTVLNFSNGLDFTSLKSDTYRVRAVRAF